MPTVRERIGKWLGFTAQPPVPTTADLMAQLLYANPRIQTTAGFRYNPNLLVQRKSMFVYDQIRKDEQVKAALSLKKQFVIAGGWEITPPEDKDKDDEVTDFVRDNFEDMGERLSTSVLQMLTCLDYGYSVTEKVYYDRPDDGKIGIKQLNTVAPHDIQFYTDPQGNLLADGGIRQQGNREQSNPLPPDKFIILSWDSEFGNWYGQSDLNSAHRPWLVKDQAYIWLAQLLERGGIPPTIIDYDNKSIADEIKNKIKSSLENWQAGSIMAFPRGQSLEGIRFQWPEMAGQVATVFIPSLDRFDKDIAKALLMPGLLGLSPDNKFGSRSNGETHFDVFLLVIEYLRTLIAGAIQTQLVKELVDLNFVVGADEYPCFKWKPLGDDVKLELMTAWGTLTGQKVVLSTPRDEEVIRERFKMPPREEAWQSVEDNPKPTDPNAPVIDPNSPQGGDQQLGPDGKPISGLPSNDGGNGLDAGGQQSGDKPSAKQDMALRLTGAACGLTCHHSYRPRAHKGTKGKRKGKAYTLPADANRDATDYERKVDFVKIEKDLQGGLTDYVPRLRSTLAESRDALIRDVRQNFNGDLSYATALSKLPATDDFHTTMQAMFKDIHKAGRDSIKTEMPQHFKSLPAADLSDALNYLNAKAIQVSGVTEQRILDQVKANLTQAVSTGEPLDDTINRLRDVFSPYVDQSMDDTNNLTDPYRLEAIVRTNLTDVYNMGRMLQARQAGDFLEGWQYSAIIDDRTTDVCRMLDGTVFNADDPRADQLRPPRHFNCRSVMVPITTGETINSDDLIDDQEFNDAMDLSGQGF